MAVISSSPVIVESNNAFHVSMLAHRLIVSRTVAASIGRFLRALMPQSMVAVELTLDKGCGAMTDPQKDKKRDDVLRRMLNTPPDPRKAKDKPKTKKPAK